MGHLINCVLVLITFLSKNICCFHVEFRHHHDITIEPKYTQTFKREIFQGLDRASYSFNGFEKINSVPIVFPLDICLMNLNDVQYAAVLHINKHGLRNFAVFNFINDNFKMIAEIVSPLAIAMDCRSIEDRGYVALAYNITSPVDNAREGSPIYEIKGNRIRSIQYFPTPNLAKIFLQKSANDVYMLQTYKYSKTKEQLQCPYFKLIGTSFTILGHIPCSNARQLEAFAIDYEIYIAVANYADQYGRTKTDSEIYKYDIQAKRFRLFQRIRTNGAVDVKYFNVPIDDRGARRQHFLIFGNSISAESSSTTTEQAKASEAARNLEADSVFYMFDNGQFVPYQQLSFYNVEHFLPIKSNIAEKFLLLVACKDQDIKIFNLNDWKFEESNVQFTEGALGRGVSEMRTFTTSKESFLVIANELMQANETNIYRPIFKQDEQAKLLTQEIIEWTKANTERLSKIDVEKLRREVEDKMELIEANKALINVKEISNSNIQIAKTKSLIYPKLKLGKNYWKALSYAKKALDLLESEMPRSAGREKRASQARVRQILKASKTTEYEFDQLDVGTLIVNDKLQATTINGFNSTTAELKTITAKRIIVTNNYESPKENHSRKSSSKLTEETEEELMEEIIKVNNLQISGKLNGFTWNELMNNTLKRRGAIQFLKAPANLRQLDVDSIAVTNNEVNGQNLSKLVPVTGSGRYVINQALQFNTPINAKNLTIHERLNNIHVHKNRLDVLLKNSNETQVIKGSKLFESIRVVESKTYSARVMDEQLLGATVNNVIPDSLTLSGDITILGDVFISNLLRADNIIIGEPKLSMRDILTKGLRVDQPLENVNINFLQPLEVNNSIVSFINAQDVQMLVKTGINDIQIVEGTKRFKNNLEIKQGFSEVKNLNGINIEELEQRLFQRSTNQTITAPMHFGKIVVKSVTTPQLILNAINLTDYLVKSGPQHIRAKLKVDKLTVTDTLHVDDLHINGKIFETRLAEIYQQKAKHVPNKNIFQKNQKFQGSIYVRNLKLNTTINGVKVDLLEQQLTQLDGNIKYVGDLKFNYDMQISNLSFYGTFNGVPAAEFGHCWLQKHGNQSFLVPQTLASVQCERGIFMKGRLNGYMVEEFITDTFWINRNEHITSIIFENPIQIQGGLLSDSINNINIPKDILYHNSTQPQVLTQSITVQDDLFVNGYISNITRVNGLNLHDLSNFLDGHGEDCLYVEEANFVFQPEFKTLNNQDLQQMLDKVWLANENVVLQQHIEISNGYFEGLLDFEGPINDVNLKYFKDNYFSLSRSQDISTEMVFDNFVKFENYFKAFDMHIFGSIVDRKSKSQFSLDEFVSKTVKTSGPHNIGGQWTLLEAIIQGDLKNVLINKLNLVNDVVRHDVSLNKITVPKHLHAARIQKLFAAPNSLVNSVNVAQWIQDAVFVYENYTISGTTILDTVNMYNDLQVNGPVNNITFDESTLLLREHDQILRGPVRIFNSFPQEQRIVPNNIENLWVETVNDWSVEQFYANQVKLSPTARVRGSLIFSNPLEVTEFHTGDDLVHQDVREKRRTSNEYRNYTLKSWSELDKAILSLKSSLTVSNHVIKDFEVHQVLKVPFENIISIPLRLNGEFVDVIGVFKDHQEKYTQFYRWNSTNQELIFSQNFPWIPQDISLDAIKLILQQDSYLEINSNGSSQHNLFNKNIEIVQMILQKKKMHDIKITRFPRNEEDCYAMYSYKLNNVTFYCFKQSTVNTTLEQTMEATINKSHIKQILGISSDLVVLRSTSSIEIWNASNTIEPKQRLDLVKPIQVAIGFKGKKVFMAVISGAKDSSLHFGTVELYCSIDNSTYVHVQTINCVLPKQIEFAEISQSDDLLLLILTESYNQPLMVYQYKGLAGFEQIVAASTLPTAHRMSYIQLKSTQQHLIALSGKHKITFVEIMLQRA